MKLFLHFANISMEMHFYMHGGPIRAIIRLVRTQYFIIYVGGCITGLGEMIK